MCLSESLFVGWARPAGQLCPRLLPPMIDRANKIQLFRHEMRAHSLRDEISFVRAKGASLFVSVTVSVSNLLGSISAIQFLSRSCQLANASSLAAVGCKCISNDANANSTLLLAAPVECAAFCVLASAQSSRWLHHLRSSLTIGLGQPSRMVAFV